MKNKLVFLFKLRSFWLFIFWLLFSIWSIHTHDLVLIWLCAFWTVVAIIALIKDICVVLVICFESMHAIGHVGSQNRQI